MLTLINVRKSFGQIVAVDGSRCRFARASCSGCWARTARARARRSASRWACWRPTRAPSASKASAIRAEPAVRQRDRRGAAGARALRPAERRREPALLRRGLRPVGRGARERVAWCLDFVGLTDRKGDRVGTYSGGMKRRLNLAAALCTIRSCCCSTSRRSASIRSRATRSSRASRRCTREGRTIIYTTHYMEEAERLCDRVAIIDAGKLLALGTLQRLLATHGGPPTLVVKTGGEEQRAADGGSAGRTEPHRRDSGDRSLSDGAPDARTGVPAPDRPQPQRLSSMRQHESSRSRSRTFGSCRATRAACSSPSSGRSSSRCSSASCSAASNDGAQSKISDCRRRRGQHRRLARVPERSSKRRSSCRR